MILHVTYAILSFYFGLFFALLQLQQIQKSIKKKKRKKNTWIYHDFKCVTKNMII